MQRIVSFFVLTVALVLAGASALYADDQLLVVSQSGTGDVAFETRAVDSVTFRPKGAVPAEAMYNEQVSRARQSLRLLVVGNSFSCNAYDYVPYLLESIVPGIEVSVGILYYSGAELSRHLTNFEEEAEVYAYYKYTGDGGWVHPEETYSLQRALADGPWDILMFQQGSVRATSYDTYQPYLDRLIDRICSAIDYPVQLGWMNVHAYADDTPSKALSIAACGKRVVEETLVDFLIPVGMAIENARTTPLGALGYDMTADGKHLAEGIPCQIAAYTVVLTLLRQMGMGHKSILGEPTRVNTAEWVTSRRCPLPCFYQQDIIPMTDEASLTAQKCAVLAVKQPYAISSIPE